jgi:hypothetical protein
LLGEPAHPRVGEQMLTIARRDRGVRSVSGVPGMRMGPYQVVALFVKPQTEETWRARRKALEEDENATLS